MSRRLATITRCKKCRSVLVTYEGEASVEACPKCKRRGKPPRIREHLDAVSAGKRRSR